MTNDKHEVTRDSRYDADLVIWDTIGGTYDSRTVREKATGGSEVEVVQLAEGLAARGYRVWCFNARDQEWRSPGGVEWRPCSEAKPGFRGLSTRCLLVQRYSTRPPFGFFRNDEPGTAFMRITDVAGEHYDANVAAGLRIIAVSDWQARKMAERYRAAPNFEEGRVVPAMLPDSYYDLTSKVPRVRGRFLYASAAMKGLQATVDMWIRLKETHADAMKHCELHVTSPGYGSVQLSRSADRLAECGIGFLGDLTPDTLAMYMATCEGLFYVNTFAETFCAVAAIAEAVGCRVHILGAGPEGLAGIAEATTSALPVTDTRVFEDLFLRGLRGELHGPHARPEPARKFAESRVLDMWETVLGLSRNWNVETVETGETSLAPKEDREALLAAHERHSTPTSVAAG